MPHNRLWGTLFYNKTAALQLYQCKKHKALNQRQDTLSLAGLDLMKLLMAYAVIAIHCRALFGYFKHAPALYNIIDWAVPFFMTASGLLLMRKLDTFDTLADRRLTLRRRAASMGRLWLRWTGVYALIACMRAAAAPEGLYNFLSNNLGCLLINGYMFPGWQLWFLYSMAIGLTLVALTYGRRGLTFGLVAVQLALYICWNLWRARVCPSSLWLKTLYLNTHFILYAPLCLLGGMWLWRIRMRLARLLVPVGAVVLATALLLTHNKWMFAPELGGLAALLLALNLRRLPGWLPSARAMRSLSMWLFYSHMMVLWAIAQFDRSGYSPWTVFGCVTALGVGLMLLRQRPGFSRLGAMVEG